VHKTASLPAFFIYIPVVAIVLANALLLPRLYRQDKPSGRMRQQPAQRADTHESGTIAFRLEKRQLEVAITLEAPLYEEAGCVSNSGSCQVLKQGLLMPQQLLN
jgi:hypothetical protein